MVSEATITIECFLAVRPLPSMVFQWFLVLLPSLSMVFDGFGPLVKRCDGFDGSLWSKRGLVNEDDFCTWGLWRGRPWRGQDIWGVEAYSPREDWNQRQGANYPNGFDWWGEGILLQERDQDNPVPYVTQDPNCPCLFVQKYFHIINIWLLHLVMHQRKKTEALQLRGLTSIRLLVVIIHCVPHPVGVYITKWKSAVRVPPSPSESW